MPAPRVLPRTLVRVAALVALSVALAAPSGLAVAQPVADSRPHAAAGGLDPAGLQEALDAVTAGEGVGAVAQVVGAKAQWSSASGVRRLAGGQPAARAQDRVRVASVTKSMVATLALQEVQRWIVARVSTMSASSMVISCPSSLMRGWAPSRWL